MNVGDHYARHHVGNFAPGREFSREFVVASAEVEGFALSSGDQHPLHRDAILAAERDFPGIPVHGMLVASRSSAFVAYDVVGTHGLLVSMTADFRRPVYAGEPLVWRAQVERVVADVGTVELTWLVTNAQGTVTQRGTACALVPITE